jgi:hypothetical protein
MAALDMLQMLMNQNTSPQMIDQIISQLSMNMAPPAMPAMQPGLAGPGGQGFPQNGPFLGQMNPGVAPLPQGPAPVVDQSMTAGLMPGETGGMPNQKPGALTPQQMQGFSQMLSGDKPPVAPAVAPATGRGPTAPMQMLGATPDPRLVQTLAQLLGFGR